MGSGSTKYSPYFRAISLEWLEQSSPFTRYSPLGQEFTVQAGVEVSGQFSQEFEVSGELNGSSSLGQYFDITSITTSGEFKQEFSTYFYGSGELQQEFEVNIVSRLGQEFRIIPEQLPDPGTTISGEVQKIFDEPEFSADDPYVEGSLAGYDPQPGDTTVTVYLDNIVTDHAVPLIEWMLGVNDPTMPLRYSGVLGWSSEDSHAFDIGTPLNQGDCIFYGVRVGDDEGEESDLIQMIPPVFLSETMSGLLCISQLSYARFKQEFTVEVGQFYPRTTTIKFGDHNAIPKVIVWDEGDDGYIHGTYIQATSAHIEYDTGADIYFTNDISSLSLPVGTFQRYGTTTCQYKKKNQREKVTIITKS